MAENSSYIPVKDWAEDDRPREKLAQKGQKSLSDAELIAILIGSGYREKSAVDVSKELLAKAGNDLASLARMTLKQLTGIKGIGEAKGITIMAALELGRRRRESDRKTLPKVSCSQDAYDYLYPYLADLSHEEFYILLLNRANQITRHTRISEGGVSGTLVDAKKVFKPALEEQACGIILCHNHPSGNLQPSGADLELTKKLKEGGRLLDVSILDHLIFTNDGFLSLADEGYM